MWNCTLFYWLFFSAYNRVACLSYNPAHSQTLFFFLFWMSLPIRLSILRSVWQINSKDTMWSKKEWHKGIKAEFQVTTVTIMQQWTVIFMYFNKKWKFFVKEMKSIDKETGTSKKGTDPGEKRGVRKSSNTKKAQWLVTPCTSEQTSHLLQKPMFLFCLVNSQKKPKTEKGMKRIEKKEDKRGRHRAT